MGTSTDGEHNIIQFLSTIELPRILELYPEALSFYLELIRGNNPASFTRYRKIALSDLLMQMLNRHGKTQWAELEEYFDFMAPVSDKAFSRPE